MASDSSGLADSQRQSPKELQPNDLQLYITISKAFQLPALKERFGGKNRQFYVNVSDGITMRKTNPIRSTAEQATTWNEKLGPFNTSISHQIILSLYSRRKTSKDELIGTLTIKSITQTRVSHPIECNLNPQPIIKLTIEINGTLPAPVRKPVEEVAATENALADDAESGKIVAEVSAAMEEAGTALISMNLHEEWKSTLEGVQWVMDVVGDLAELNPYAKLAYDALSLLPRVFTAQFERDENVQALSKAMRDAFNLAQAEDLLKVIKPNSNQALILKLMLKHIKICSDVIRKYAEDQEFSKRLLRNTIVGVGGKIKALCDTLLELRDDLLRNAAISTQIGVEVVKKNTEILSTRISDIEYDAKIDDLPYKSGWSLTSTRNGCIAGTRTAFLEYILGWVRDPSSERVLVLFGQAGTGKSTIAFEIASLFCIEYHICPYFSFSRADIFKGEDYHFLTTIIRDLADRHSTFKSALGALIKDKTHLRKSADFNTLFDSLLIPSLENVGDNVIPELIVVDAVDESSDPSKLAAFLARSLNRLPKNFRILITSRPEYDIKLEFITGQKTDFATLEMNDPKLAARTKDDIRVYLQEHLSLSDFEQYGEALIKKSEGLFQWVVVATGYLKKPPPGFTRTTCMRGILGQTSDDKEYTHDLMAPLHTLYTTVFAGYFTTTTAKSLFRSVMSQFFSTLEPISADILTHLRQYMPRSRDDEAVPAIVQYLGSVLSNTTSDKSSQPIVPLHISFRDFLVDQEHQHTFSVDLPTAHAELAHACIDIMLEKLEFNICKLESSYLRNSEVNGLQVRIAKWLHPSLQYACRFWHQHVYQISVDDVLLDKLAKFFRERFLNWLEVMSLINQIPRAASALPTLINRLNFGENTTKTSKDKLNEIIRLVTDSSRFLKYFAHAIATSVPHIYISALPFTPTSSDTFQAYSSAFPSTLSFQPERGQLIHWPALDMTITLRSGFSSVAVSPDGQWMATGSDDFSVSLWNSTTGVQQGKPLIGHNAQVNSVAFSPDGRQIASGADDGKICVWNISKGEMQDKPLAFHHRRSWVLSVAFSPDGEYIASGSGDHTVGVWKASSGNMVGTPLKGHSAWVKAVAFSPDGKYIVSGSYDNIILLWNVSTQMIEGQPFLGHTGRVNSVAFSPDGRHIVSGSDDNTIRLWNISTQTREGITFNGHTAGVNSVSFSPDGKWIASGSSDTTVCIWNAATGVLEGSPMTDHASFVYSVAFFPDNEHVVSIANDSKLCVWNVPPPVMNSGGSLSGHLKRVTAVAFSLDGEKMISGSADGKIFVWNITTQRMEGAPLTGPQEWITAVASSPDGKWIASGSTNGEIILWDTSTNMMHVTLIGHRESINTIAFSPDGGYILSGSSVGTICMWTVPLGTKVGNPFDSDWDEGDLHHVSFSIDGQHILSASDRATIYMWNISTRSLQKYSYPRQTKNITVLSGTISRDGQQAAFGMDDNTIHVMDVVTESVKSIISVAGSTESLATSVSFSPDGKILASGSTDGGVDLWDVSTGSSSSMKVLKVLAGHTSFVGCVRFSSDGDYLVSLDQPPGYTLRLWPVPDFTETSTSASVVSSDVALTDESVIDGDGWVCGSQGELLIWIPPIHRMSLHRPSNIFILGGHETRLDTSKFVHGLNWTNCRAR